MRRGESPVWRAKTIVHVEELQLRLFDPVAQLQESNQTE
jgi:hypothetical protein